MKRALVAMLLLCSGCATLQSRPPPVQPEPASEVRAAADKFLVAFDNLDWEPFKASWAASPSVFFPFPDKPKRIDGKAEVERVFAAFFEEVRKTAPGPPYLHLNPQELQVQVFGDSALVTFMLVREKRISRRSLLFVREAGEWKLVHLHASNVDQ
jgi:ketosteroid isomerase-like protein